jgi:hypothetical protein
MMNYAAIAADAKAFAATQTYPDAANIASNDLLEAGWQNLAPFSDRECVALAVMLDMGVPSRDAHAHLIPDPDPR